MGAIRTELAVGLAVTLSLSVLGYLDLLGMSIGAITFTAPPEGVEHLVQQADALMYETKRSGKNALRTRVA